MEERNLLLLYASQTGNAQEVAESLTRDARRRHYSAIARSMDSFNVRDLPSQKLVVFVVAASGQGDPPDSMRRFWRFLLRKDLPPRSLEHLRFGLFGLGDSSYEKFNFMGKKLYRRLLQLGAASLLRRGDGDDQHPYGYFGELDPWSTELWGKLKRLQPLPAPVVSRSQRPSPAFVITAVESTRDVEPALPACSSSSAKRFDYRNPFHSRVLVNKRLTASGWEQAVHHIEFDLDSCTTGITYLPGDVINIMPRNSAAMTKRFLRRKGTELPPVPLPITIESLVKEWLDVQFSPRRYFFELLSHFAEDAGESKRLMELAEPKHLDEWLEYCSREKRTIVEVLEDFPSVRPPFEYLLDFVPLMRARPFSISSAFEANPGVAHVTVAQVHYTTPMGRHRYGLCSSYLAAIQANETTRVPVWVSKGYTALPTDPATPIIMVGPGTGLAMFRAFLQHRKWQKEKGVTVGDCAFFFGCRHSEMDYLYEPDWEELQREKVLRRFCVAFSRDQEEKVYVQHKLLEHAALVWDWLSARKAHFYISGNARKMPEAVRDAVLKALEDKGGLLSEQASHMLKNLMMEGRWHTETWY